VQPAVMARAASMCEPKQVARALWCQHMRPNTEGERPCSTQLSIKLPTKAALQHLIQHGQLGVAPTSPGRRAQGGAQPAAKRGTRHRHPPPTEPLSQLRQVCGRVVTERQRIGRPVIRDGPQHRVRRKLGGRRRRAAAAAYRGAAAARRAADVAAEGRRLQRR